MATVAIAAACGSTSTTSVGPTPQKCELTLQMPPGSVSGSGGTRIVSIAAAPECSWNASPQVNWITRVTPASGQGNGQVTFDVVANTGAARSGSLVIGEQAVTVSQDPVCTFTVQPTSHTGLPAGGTTRTSTVTAGAGCAWASSTSTPWITITAGSGTGSGTAGFSVGANTGPQRTGSLTIAGRNVSVTQSSGCTYSINPTSRQFGVAGGSQSVTVTAPVGCTWTATSSVPWATITSGASGSGNGTVVYTVGPNIGTRTGSLTIATQTHSIRQN